jgi:hypothetical protein
MHHTSARREQVLVEQLMSMKADEAALAGQGYLELWGFPGTYCFAKHLAEKLVADYQAKRCARGGWALQICRAVLPAFRSTTA